MKTYFLKKLSIFSFCFLPVVSIFAQQNGSKQIIRFTSIHTSFPDSARSTDHIYDSVHYTPKEHYNDNSVLMILPDHFDKQRKVDLVFWFHGWFNNIDTALRFFEIDKQFLESKKNAVLVLAETAKNAPDSYGGKLEQKGIFKSLVQDVIEKLKQENLVGKKAEAGNIILAGHSGAYRVIAHILVNGDVPVAEVCLFDAMYGQTEKFLSWIQSNKSHRLINWYTNQGGGTDEVSIQMMKQLQDIQVPYQLVEEPSINAEAVKANRILFVHSARGHNVIINRPDNLKLALENSVFLK